MVAPALGDGLESPHVVVDDATGEALATYVYAGEHAQMRYRGSEPTYYLRDAMGSVIALADGTGTRLARYEYDAFGNERIAEGPEAAVPPELGGEPRFQGMWREPNGTYFVRARQYDPVTGRFLTKDAAEGDGYVPETWPRYAFVENAPTVATDPTGLFTLKEAVTVGRINQILSTQARAAIKSIGRDAVEDAGFEILTHLAGRAVSALAPMGSGIATPTFGDASLSGSRGGTSFGDLLEGALCGMLGSLGVPVRNYPQSNAVPNLMWLEVPISGSGAPGGNGFVCQQPPNLREDGTSYKTRRARVGGFPSGTTFPDFLFSPYPPDRLQNPGARKSLLILEVSLNILSKRADASQAKAIVAHADNYSYAPVAAYLVLRPFRPADALKLRNAASRAGVALEIFSVL